MVVTTGICERINAWEPSRIHKRPSLQTIECAPPALRIIPFENEPALIGSVADLAVRTNNRSPLLMSTTRTCTNSCSMDSQGSGEAKCRRLASLQPLPPLPGSPASPGDSPSLRKHLFAARRDFQHQEEPFDRTKSTEEMLHKLTSDGVTENDLRDFFSQCDANNDGYIDRTGRSLA